MPHRLPIALFIIALVSSGCSHADDTPVPTPLSDELNQFTGLISVESDTDVATTYGRLLAALNANESISVMAEIDHQANAVAVGLTLPPIRVVVFGNPNLGTPFMQAAPTAAIDLPQKMLVWEDEAGQVFVSYNDPHYIANRHGATDVSTMQQISGALESLANVAAGVSPPS